MIGLSIIVRNESEYNKASEFIGKEYCYLDWVPQMAERETAVVIYAKKKIQLNTGAIGCAKAQREYGIRTVEFNDFFKL